MNKQKLVNLIDKIFITCAIFLIIYAWVNFYLRDLWITFFTSLIFTFASVFILFYFTNKKQTKTLTSLKQKETINTNFLAFKLMPTKEKIKLLNTVLSKTFLTTCKNNKIKFTDNNNKKNIVILATNYNIITDKDLLNILDENLEENLDIINIVCEDISTSLNHKILNNLEIKFITKKELYLNYFLKHNSFPNLLNLNLKNNNLKFKDIINNLFKPEKAKSYFFCGCVLIFSSIILPYLYYYLIVGTILLLFALICKILPKVKD